MLGLQTKLQAGDKAGFFGDISGLNGSRAGDSAVRSGLSTFVGSSLINWAEAFRAAAMLELGPERGWPDPVKNYNEGVASGVFSLSQLPPAGADALRQFCMIQAGEAAEGTSDLMAVYRNQFSARWDSPTYAGRSTTHNPALDSKGPQNDRARAIFTDLYAEARFQTAYDTNTPSGFRDQADTLQMPDGVNLIASPRLQTLRALLNPPVVSASGTTDAAYVALVGAVRPAAQALEAPDRQEIRNNHTWRLAVDAKVSGTTTPVTQTLRDDLWSVVISSRAPAAAPAPPSTGPAPPEPVPTPNAGQTAWLNSISLTAPSGPVQAQSSEQDLTFGVASTNPNPGLGVRRKLKLEPTAQVSSGSEDEVDWPSGSSRVDHTFQVDPDAGGAAATTFTGRLTMPPLSTSTFSEQTATVSVQDKRQDWFVNNIAHGATWMNENQNTALSAGDTVSYYGGQYSLTVRPRLPAVNPGLDVQMEGELKKGSASIHTFARTPFSRNLASSQLGYHVLQEPTPAPTAPEAHELKVTFYAGTSATVLKTPTLPFSIGAGPTGGPARDNAILAADTAQLNSPATTSGTLLHYMKNNFPAGSPEQQVADAVISGVIQVQACIVRSDSAAWLTANGHSAATNVAYAVGQVDNAHTLVAAPGAAGWRWGRFANTVFLNLTPVTQNPGTKRGNSQMAELLTHEGIHAADRSQGAPIDRYATEFRAYWIMGTGAGQSEAPDPSMSGMGPKSERARTIFLHLYGHPLYSQFTQPNYDANTNHFREQVDNMLVPDGINLTLSRGLHDLRQEVESYSGSGYAAKRAAVQTKITACTPGDLQEVRSNRAWRDMVEQKYTGTAMLGATPVDVQVDMKTLLGIPR